MGPFGGDPHFIDKESGTKRGCNLLEVTQLTIVCGFTLALGSGPEPMSSDSQHLVLPRSPL